MADELVPVEIREAFVEVISATVDCDWRDRFHAAGIRADFPPSRYSAAGHPEYLQPLNWRIEQYLNTVDWTNRAEIARVLPIVELHVARLRDSMWWKLEDLLAILKKYGLCFFNGKIQRIISEELS